MSLRSDAPGRGVYRFPRVSGDEPDMTMNTVARREFSPRERG